MFVVADRRTLYADSYAFCASTAQFIWRFTSEIRTFAAALVTYVVPSLAVPEEVGVPVEAAVEARANIAGNVYTPLSKKLGLSKLTPAGIVAAKKVCILISDVED